MSLGGSFSNLQLPGNLLVGQTLDQKVVDLPFAVAELLDSSEALLSCVFGGPGLPVGLKGFADCREQGIGLNGFFQKVQGSMFDPLDDDAGARPGAHEQYRQARATCHCALPLVFVLRHDGDVQEQASTAGVRLVVVMAESSKRCACTGQNPVRMEDREDVLPAGGVLVDDEDRLATGVMVGPPPLQIEDQSET